MFGHNGVSMPEAFVRDHQPLRLTAESSRPQPTGSCHFLQVNPSAKSRICACQIYHHNRTAPGDVCDCGHAACYHSPTPGDKVLDGSSTSRGDLIEKIRKLEDMVQADKDLTSGMLAREQSAQDRAADTLREALATFHKTQLEMQRKLLEMEHKLDNSLDAQHRLSKRVSMLDDANLALNKRLAAVPHHGRPKITNGTNHASPNVSDDVPGLTSGDEHSSTSSFSRHETPFETTATSTTSGTHSGPDSPRSSGILNLTGVPRPPAAPYVVSRPRHIPLAQPEREEPRSSGFLGVDLKEQIRINIARKKRQQQQQQQQQQNAKAECGRASPSNSSPAGGHRHHPYQHEYHYHHQQRKSPAPSGGASSSSSVTASIRRSTPRSLPRPSPPVSGYVSADHLIYSHGRGPGLKTHTLVTRSIGPDLMALDVLANVSAASAANQTTP